MTPDEYEGESWAERVEHAARNTVLRTGELLVAPFDSVPAARGVVEAEIDGIGTLRNRVI